MLMLRPLHQGQLDGFCGFYAVINATRMAIEHNISFNTTDCSKLACAVITDFDRRQRLGTAFAHGVGSNALCRIIHRADSWMMANKRISIKYHRPWVMTGETPSKATVLTGIKDHIAKPNASAIVEFKGGMNHWTVIPSITDKRVLLFDSVGRRFVRIQDIEVPPHSPPAHRYQLNPRNVFLLSAVPLNPSR